MILEMPLSQKLRVNYSMIWVNYIMSQLHYDPVFLCVVFSSWGRGGGGIIYDTVVDQVSSKDKAMNINYIFIFENIMLKQNYILKMRKMFFTH